MQLGFDGGVVVGTDCGGGRNSCSLDKISAGMWNGLV